MSAGKKRAAVRTSEKSAKKSPGKPFTGADDPRRGRGPAPGTGGRPPDEFKARMRELATLPEVQRELERVLKSQLSRDWLGALKYVTEHGYGKPKEHLELSGKIGLERLIEESMKDRDE